MKTLYKTAAIVGLLGGLIVATQAQTVIGNWQSAPIPPSPANDEGWQRGQGGFGPDGSIFASSNYPAFFELKTNVAAGYAQSLDIHETGYGNVRLYISLSASQIAAFTNNTTLNFTLSVPPGDTNTANGYIQQVDFQYNSAGTGFKNGAPSTAKGWSETGATNNNSGGQPIFDYYTTAPARQQVVSWNYSSIVSNVVGSSYLQFVWVFQTSGGELTNIYINNVTLSGAPGNPSIILDQFNPTDNPYAGTNIYANGDITNVYANWFGSAFSNAVWDATMDAQGNTNSGSLKITANFGTNGGDQFVVWDRGPGNIFSIIPPITNGLGLLTFECDALFATNSPTWVNGGSTNYGNLQFGPVPPYTEDDFGNTQVNVTNTGWTHIVIPLHPATDPNLLNISGIFIKIDGQSYGNLQGTTTLWVDNLKFTYTNITVVPPPVVTIQKPSPAMRLFAGSGGTYDRQEVATVDQSQSWVGATPASPVSYSFTVKNIPSNIGQTHIFLIPVNSTPGASPYGYNGIDFTATNGLWLTINPAGVAIVSWKTNQPGSNPYQTGQIALQFTNTPAAGTWTLTFTDPNDGMVTGPGGTPMPFTVTNGTVTTDFANPLVAYFGLQGNNSPGTYEDWTAISVTNVTGVNEREDFTTEPNRSLSALWDNMSGAAADLLIISTNDMPSYWVTWSLPAINFSIGTKTNLLQAGPWINPAWYSGYNDESAPFGLAQQLGPNMGIMLPKDDLPTVDGTQNGVPAPMAVFLVSTNTVSP
jgi:hypothetical protein